MSVPGQDAVNRFLENEVRLDNFLNNSSSYTDKNSNIVESLPHLAARVNSMTLNISVKDYGAKIDGINDDTSAVQLAVDSFNGKPGLIKVPRGVMKINGTINCPVGTCFDFDETVLDISNNTNPEVFSFNHGYVGGTIFVASPTVFRGCRVNGNTISPNTTTWLWLINRMPYFYAEDVTAFNTQMAHVIGESILAKFHRCIAYNPVGTVFWSELGGVAPWGANGMVWSDGYIEESPVIGTIAFEMTVGSIIVRNTYMEAISTWARITKSARITFEGCELGIRPSVNWIGSNATLTMVDISNAELPQTAVIINDCSITFAGAASWTIYGFFVKETGGTALVLINNCQIINASSGTTSEVTLFKLRAPINGQICGNTVQNLPGACKLNIFDTQWPGSAASVAMSITGNTFQGAAYSGSDPINFEIGGGAGSGIITCPITGNNFLRTTQFLKLTGSVIDGNTFVNSYAPTISDSATVASRSIIRNNTFSISPTITNVGFVENNVGLSDVGAGININGPSMTPTGPVFHVTAQSNQLFTWGACPWNKIMVIPDIAFTYGAGGNIAISGTAVIGKTLTFTFDGAIWYPSY